MLNVTIGTAEKGSDWLDFISSLVGSLAWPVAAVVIALMFRKQIVTLLSNLHEFALGDAKLTFKKELSEAEVQMEAAETDPESKPKPIGGPDPAMAFDQMPPSLSEKKQLEDAQELLRISKIVTVSPAAAVLEAWMVLSRAVEKLAVKHGLGESKPYMGRTFETAKRLKEKDVFSTKIMVLLADLRKTRNAAAHAREVDAESAIRYIDLVGRFLKLIEDL